MSTCDRCGAPGRYVAEKDFQFLVLCAYHLGQFRKALLAKGWAIAQMNLE